MRIGICARMLVYVTPIFSMPLNYSKRRRTHNAKDEREVNNLHPFENHLVHLPKFKNRICIYVILIKSDS